MSWGTSDRVFYMSVMSQGAMALVSTPNYKTLEQFGYKYIFDIVFYFFIYLFGRMVSKV